MLVNDLTRVDVVQYRSFNVVVMIVSPPHCALAALARASFFYMATGFLKRRTPTFLMGRTWGGERKYLTDTNSSPAM